MKMEMKWSAKHNNQKYSQQNPIIIIMNMMMPSNPVPNNDTQYNQTVDKANQRQELE